MSCDGSKHLGFEEAPVPTLLEGTRLHIKPDADVSQLFEEFNQRFFWGKLLYVEVRWSPRMTLCAGVCVFNRRPGYCSIRLSRPLLSLRSKVDLVETLLHEMIHAYLFVTRNDRDRDGHGPEFLSHMVRINKDVGLNISVFHTFSDEVKHYQQHVWLCNGSCQSHPPYFGKVHRSMNRAPGPTDYWWYDHKLQCGGTFNKIAEPQGYIPKLNKKRFAHVTVSSRDKKDSPVNSKDIRSFFKPISHRARQDWENQSRSQSSGSKHVGSHKKSSVDVTSPNLNTDSDNHSSCEVPKHIVDDTTTESISDSNEHIPDTSGKESSDISESASNENVDDASASCSSSDYDTDSSDVGDEDYVSIFGSLFRMPNRFSKRPAQDPDPSTIEVKKPNLSAMPKSKRGTLKNLIKVPNQPTLDNFYKKKSNSSKVKTTVSTMKLNQRDTLKQPSVHSFLTK